ncbi:hypothetical protein [Ahniella affigens]|uniref:hypothetical protein n=1 Tax=Ahniella affigens TaxID=2021234 RepID=UPI0011B2655C|nr:hypothetical protein [Ahniella affigens]
MLKRVVVLAAIAVLGMLIMRLVNGPERITAEMVVAKAHGSMTFPVDLGDDMFIDRIESEGNAVVSTVSMRSIEIGQDREMFADALRKASISDSCREMQSMKDAFARSGLTLVKQYMDKNGDLIVRVSIGAADCP